MRHKTLRFLTNSQLSDSFKKSQCLTFATRGKNLLTSSPMNRGMTSIARVITILSKDIFWMRHKTGVLTNSQLSDSFIKCITTCPTFATRGKNLLTSSPMNRGMTSILSQSHHNSIKGNC